MFSHTQRGYQFLFLDYYFCYFTLLLIFTKIILLLLFYYIFFSWKLFLFLHVPGSSGMFRDVPECSGMFHVPDFIDGRQNDGCLSIYIINTIPHGKCFVRYLRTRSLRSLVRFLIRQQLVRKYRTPALSMKYSLYIIRRIHTVKTMAISRLTFVSSVPRTSATSLLISHQSARSRK